MALSTLTWILSSLPACAIDQAFQWWQPVYLDFPVKGKIRGYLESNSRLTDGLDGMDQYLLRSALGWRVRPSIEILQGFAYVNNYPPTRLEEFRPYQQVGVGHVLFKRFQTLHRLRSEQRFIQHRDGVANRLRYLLRIATPFRNTDWYLVTSDELFINLNSLENGPNAGIDQNRLYGGIGRQINRKLRVEAGYQFQYVNRTDPTADKAAHQLMTQAFISL